ncbi:histidine kinase [Actinoplanes sp. HUAS TT8]|uniref:sensor histidine kinase n=1 Tax=Actinoplanes sp. HUAS TT8 TaxID=3447453 RepID=UPI003F51DEE2
MPGSPQRRSMPLGAWVALLWCAATFWALRGFSRVPGMPSGLPTPPAWVWAVTAVCAVGGLAAAGLARRRPLPALYLLVGAATVMVLVLGHDAMAASLDTSLAMLLLAADVVMAHLVASRPRRTWPAGLLPVLAVEPVGAALRAFAGHPDDYGRLGPDLDWTAWVAFVVLPLLVAGLVGFSVRQARGNARRLREQAATQAVMAERLRISRELHDQVAHSIGIIALQAGAAARVITTQPEQAREAMRAVEATGRDTLAGLRRMVGTLREADQPRPAGLADVDRLVAATVAAGVAVDLSWHGARRPLPEEVELSAYRVIQESLTNVLRHAGAGVCRVSVTYHPADLAIEVDDDGPGTDPTGPAGFGLIGLRERVALLDGTFAAGTRPGGGFRVAVCLPAAA